jgi:hypothetical protein
MEMIVMSANFERALRVVRTYLAECAADRSDPRRAELNAVIRDCVGFMSVNRLGHEQGSNARLRQEALRHALGYVDEYSYPSAIDDWGVGRPAG